MISVCCPVCGSRDYRVKYKPWVEVKSPVELYGAACGVHGTQQLVICRDCRMIYECPRYSDEVVMQGYAASQEEGHDSQYPMRIDSFYRTLRSLKRLIAASGAQVLDIGTAGGAFLEAAQRFGYHARGLEPSSYLVEQGRKRGLNIEHGTIHDHPFKMGAFDLVCLWDVIEHLTDPKDSLVKIRPLLKPDGILLINFPDIGTWQAKLAGKHFWWIISNHLHYFTRDTLSALCRKTGFDPFYFRRYWQTLRFGYLQDMAVHYKVPLSRLANKMTPQFIKNMPFSYYASQTTVLSRLKT